NTHAFVVAHFVAALKQKLHSEADAEIWDTCGNGISNGLHQILFAQLVHTRAERAHAGKNDLPRAFQVLRVLHDTHILDAEVLERVDDTPQVPCPVINYRQHGDTSPLKQKPRVVRGCRQIQSS